MFQLVDCKNNIKLEKYKKLLILLNKIKITKK